MIRVTIDPASARQFRSEVELFARATGKTVDEVVIELARSAGKQLAHKVPPWGLNAQVGKRFEGSVAKQVNRAVRAANVGTVNGSTADEAHARARDSRGQVPKMLRTKGKYVRNPIPVSDKERLVDKKQEAAGAAKGAWIAAVMQISGKRITGVARWITRHQRHGRSTVMRRGINTEITLTNEIRYIQRLQTPAMVKMALRQAYQNTLRFMQRKIEKS